MTSVHALGLSLSYKESIRIAVVEGICVILYMDTQILMSPSAQKNLPVLVCPGGENVVLDTDHDVYP